MAKGDMQDAGKCETCGRPLVSYEDVEGIFHKFPMDAVNCSSDIN